MGGIGMDGSPVCFLEQGFDMILKNQTWLPFVVTAALIYYTSNVPYPASRQGSRGRSLATLLSCLSKSLMCIEHSDLYFSGKGATAINKFPEASLQAAGHCFNILLCVVAVIETHKQC